MIHDAMAGVGAVVFRTAEHLAHESGIPLASDETRNLPVGCDSSARNLRDDGQDLLGELVRQDAIIPLLLRAVPTDKIKKLYAAHARFPPITALRSISCRLFHKQQSALTLGFILTPFEKTAKRKAQSNHRDFENTG